MPSFKWMFRLAILLSFAWIAYGQPPSPNPDGTPPTGVDAVLARVTTLVNSFRDQATQRIATELGNRLGENASALDSPLLSELKQKATSALQDARTQLGGNLTSSGDINVQALLKNASQLDERQVMSQLQNGVQRLIQQTGTPNPELRLGEPE